MKTNDVWNEIQNHWSIIVDHFSKNYDYNNLRLRTHQGKDKLPKLEIIEKPRRKKKEFLEVVFENGETISSKNQNDADVFVEVIKRADVDSVENLKLDTQGGIPIIIDGNKGNQKDGYVPVENKLVFTKTGIDQKKTLIEKIITGLKLKAKVSISTL